MVSEGVNEIVDLIGEEHRLSACQHYLVVVPVLDDRERGEVESVVAAHGARVVASVGHNEA